MDKLKAILAILKYIPDIMRAIDPLFGEKMGPQKKALVKDIINTAIAGGDVLDMFIDKAAAGLTENDGWNKPSA